MGRLKGFYTEEAAVDDGGLSDSEVFAQIRLKRERGQAKVKQFEQWKVEIEQCSTKSSLRNYINVHKNDAEYPFIQEAENKLIDLTFSNRRRAEEFKKYILNSPSSKHTEQGQPDVKRVNASYHFIPNFGTSGDEIWRLLRRQSE